MRILVTGGAGYIGSHFALRLAEAGHEPVIYDNLSTGHSWSVLGAELIEAELSDQARLDALLSARRFDAVAHFAASAVVPESVERPLKYYRNNTANTLGLVECCARAGVERLIFSSTAAVYGEPAETPIDENAPLAPINPYGASKAMSERIIRDQAAASGLRYVILRYFNVAGADPEGRIGQVSANATHLIKIACEAAVGRRPGMSIFGSDYPTEDGTCIRDYIHVDDLVMAHLDALRYLDAGGESATFNCGYSHGASVRQVIETVKRLCGTDFPVQEAPRRAGDPTALVARSDRLRERLGWQPRHDDLDTIVRTALDWERSAMSRGL